MVSRRVVIIASARRLAPSIALSTESAAGSARSSRGFSLMRMLEATCSRCVRIRLKSRQSAQSSRRSCGRRANSCALRRRKSSRSACGSSTPWRFAKSAICSSDNGMRATTRQAAGANSPSTCCRFARPCITICAKVSPLASDSACGGTDRRRRTSRSSNGTGLVVITMRARPSCPAMALLKRFNACSKEPRLSFNSSIESKKKVATSD